ncbi:MAG: tRNA 2-selenouridine(34) synthase MnmH [Bacteroidia bacterium]|jgi:tRNA 2-selenouridine synthase|nr:tRNA 2-selenouridine(34) synthase MnmH [Bacteroidia bacterium]
MAIENIGVYEFLALAKSHPIVDVRSPKEYNHAHVPGATSLPIFNDEERAEIGTLYKRVSRKDAIKAGLMYYGAKLTAFVEAVEAITDTSTNTVLVHCWRGGMRSQAMAWLLSFYGYDVKVLTGGYKAYRHFVLDMLNFPYKLNVIGGFTGSGKTEVLVNLQKRAIAAINLEHLAQHKGSAFGNLEQHKQPSQEQFENNLVHELLAYLHLNENGEWVQKQTIWIENESQRIGDIDITKSFYGTMLKSPIIALIIPFDQRLNHIINGYGHYSTDVLENAVLRIQKKLGGAVTKEVLTYLAEKDIRSCFAQLLRYYDRLYQEAMVKSGRKATLIHCQTINATDNANQLILFFHH